MAENPYQSPATDARAVGVLSGRIEDLHKVAKYQKGILVCILIQLIAVAAQLALPEELRVFVALGSLVVGLVSTVFVFLLAVNVYSTALGVVLGVLALIPCLGLVALLIVNQKATNVLKQNGIRVGLLGANLSQI
jgi:hypothetical protein